MYTEKTGHLSAAAAVTLSSTGVTVIGKVISGFQIGRIVAVVTTALNSTGATVVQWIYRPTPGSATGQVVLGTLNIPSTAVVGNCVYKDISPSAVGENVLLPGGELVVNVATAATTAGAAVLSQEILDNPLNAKAVSSMVLSS